MFIDNISVKRNSCVSGTYNISYGDIILLSVDRGSRIEKASVSSEVIPDIHIGQFCTLKNNITMQFLANNFFHRVTTSDDQHVAALAGDILNSPDRVKCQIIIQNDVWIGDNVTIKGGVKISNGAVVLENSCVTGDIPPYAIVEGNPATITGYRFTEDQISDLQNIAWWDWDSDTIIARKQDLYLPVQDFINKYRTDAPVIAAHPENCLKRILMFPDFDYPGNLWKKIMEEYCDRCVSGNVLGQLIIYVYQDSNTDDHIKALQDVFEAFNDEKADIVVKVGQVQEEPEVFQTADYFVTTKESYTVYHTCLADKYGVKIIAGCDMPDVFGTIC